MVGKRGFINITTYDVFQSCIFVNEIEGFALTSGFGRSLRCGIIKRPIVEIIGIVFM